jgi:phosphatidate cytidylyltransferase
LIVLLVCGIFDAGIDFARLGYYFTGGTLVALGLHMVYVMRMHLGLSYVLLLAIATLGADTFAYFVGRAIGKHKLNPRLSPNKTIEGSIGGIICGGTLALAFGFLMKMPLSLWQLAVISYVLSSTGQIGDLTFSSIKRYFDVKDYSQIFPGHGGVLDRFDSIIFNAMVLGLLLNILL